MIYNSTECYGVIYAITHIESGKTYIGQTINWTTRLSAYRRFKNTNQPKIHRAMVKHGLASFTLEVIDMAVDKIQLDFLECLYISKFNSIANGYNCKDGGHNAGMQGESVVKMSTSLSGRKLSETHRQRMVEAWARRKLAGAATTPEQKRKQSEAKKRSWAAKGSRQARPVLCVTTGTTYPNATAAGTATSTNFQSIYRCLAGTQGYSGSLPDGTKLQWKYA